MSNGTTLAYDGNNFCYKAVSIYKGIKGEKLFQIDKERDEFLNILAINFIAEYNRFKQIINRIIVVADSRSWRYDIYPDYKGNRVKADDINWHNYAILVNEFYDILATHGIIISKSFGAEGDDLIYRWAEYLNNQNENVIILSMDRDLTQLTNYVNGVFTVQYDNTFKILFGVNDFFNALDLKDTTTIVDVFSINDTLINEESMSDDTIGLFNRLLKKVKMSSINLNSFIFNKMLRGDKGDNVLAPYTIVKNKRRYGIGEKAADKIMNTYNLKNKFKISHLFDDTSLRNMSSLIRLSMKLDASLNSKVIEGLELNRSLMLLSDTAIPKKIMDGMNENIKDSISTKLDESRLRNPQTLLGKTGATQRKSDILKLF